MTDNISQTLCFIGAGNMAGSLIGGLLAQGYPRERLIAFDINADQLSRIEKKFSIRVINELKPALREVDVVILAVKPQVMQKVCKSIAPELTAQATPLFISVAAGVRMIDMQRWLGGNPPMVRCMPNTPALVNLGASGLFASCQVNAEQKRLAERVLNSAGVTVWVPHEKDLDTVTAISGSGPAYFFLFIEALQQAGQQLGLDADTASLLARQTALGAASMAMDGDVVTLRQQVTSKGGTTEKAIASFIDNGLQRLVLEAASAARQRSEQLASELAIDHNEQ